MHLIRFGSTPKFCERFYLIRLPNRPNWKCILLSGGTHVYCSSWFLLISQMELPSKWNILASDQCGWILPHASLTWSCWCILFKNLIVLQTWNPSAWNSNLPFLQDIYSPIQTSGPETSKSSKHWVVLSVCLLCVPAPLIYQHTLQSNLKDTGRRFKRIS